MACWAQSAPDKPADATKSADAPCSTAKPASSGQDGSQSGDGTQTSAKPCGAASGSTTPKSVADQFPFPGEDKQPEAPSANTPVPSASHPSATSQHPFPGEPPSADSGSGSSSSDSSSSSSSDDDNYDPNAPLPSTLKKPPPAPKPQTADQRVDEDLRVAKFYLDGENLPGAYLRAKDAVRVEPDYSETHFMLAQVLEKMKKKDEAVAEYKAYLKMDPDGDRVKAVEKALNELK